MLDSELFSNASSSSHAQDTCHMQRLSVPTRLRGREATAEPEPEPRSESTRKRRRRRRRRRKTKRKEAEKGEEGGSEGSTCASSLTH